MTDTDFRTATSETDLGVCMDMMTSQMLGMGLDGGICMNDKTPDVKVFGSSPCRSFIEAYLQISFVVFELALAMHKADEFYSL
ncbi:hypothetical protein BaRGS_00026456 [Batillaria attramentaria]|uniref:Uncharacterized protein n=1 Tax=Batillaria attramentaria TaxID=370345 RepID=A0ABD0K5F9_9CAEN